MRRLIDKSRKIYKQFPRQWDDRTAYINLVEEIGELANAILVRNNHKSPKRQRAKLHDAFADVLFSLIILADSCKVDLEKELSVMLGQLQERILIREYHD